MATVAAMCRRFDYLQVIDNTTYLKNDRGVSNNELSSARLIGATGAATFALIIAGSFIAPPLWDAPGTQASGAEAAAYGFEHRDRIIAALVVFSFAMGLLLYFVAGLWGLLRESERAPYLLSSAFAFGAVALSVLILAGFVPAFLVSYRQQPDVLAGMLGDLAFGLLALSGVPTAVCLAAYAELVARSGCLPRWTAGLAAVGALSHLLIAASFISHGSFLSLHSQVRVWVPATFFAWILAVSVVLLRPTGSHTSGASLHAPSVGHPAAGNCV